MLMPTEGEIWAIIYISAIGTITVLFAFEIYTYLRQAQLNREEEGEYDIK
jgi:hypothetical protein